MPASELRLPDRAGRPTKLTRERAHTIYEHVRAGATFRATCRAVGISKEVFRRWRRPCADETPEHEHDLACVHLVERLERNGGVRVGTGEFVPFVVLVEQAMGEHEAELAQFLTTRALNDPRVAMTLLSCRYPESWSLGRAHGADPSDGARLDVAAARARVLENVRRVRAQLLGANPPSLA